MDNPREKTVRGAELKARLGAYLRAARRDASAAPRLRLVLGERGRLSEWRRVDDATAARSVGQDVVGA